MAGVVTDDEIAAAVRALENAGAQVVVTLPGPYGAGRIVQLTPGNAARLVKDPEGFIAAQVGVTVEQMEQWELFDREPRCAGWTQAGQRCMKALSPHTPSDPEEFVARHRVEFCHMHR